MEQAKMGALRVLVETYYDVQDQRIRGAHRIRQYTEITDTPERMLEGWHDEIDKRMSSSEGYLQRRVQKLLDDEPLWRDWLVDVRGIGPCLAGGIMAWLDPAKAPHRSSFWKYAGLSVQDGEQEKRKRGQKIQYVPKLKTLSWKIGESFIKQTKPHPSEYRRLYERFRIKVNNQTCSREHIIDGKKVECFDAHKYAKAKRLTVKIFLAHVWEVWRRMEGLPVEDPYPMAHKGHSMNDYIPPMRDKGVFTGQLAA